MAENKTKATDASIEAYLESRASAEQSADCQTLMAMFARVTNEKPKMWGPSIVGYGKYQYKYESGRTGESALAGFAIRGRELVLYLAVETPQQQELLAKLGPHKMGKSCLYIKRLASLDAEVLEGLIAGSVAEISRKHVVSAA